ncbi:hypothetical protein U9M48_013761, partial [Paspalum notatum var. saurae]
SNILINLFAIEIVPSKATRIIWRLAHSTLHTYPLFSRVRTPGHLATCRVRRHTPCSIVRTHLVPTRLVTLTHLNEWWGVMDLPDYEIELSKKFDVHLVPTRHVTLTLTRSLLFSLAEFSLFRTTKSSESRTPRASSERRGRAEKTVTCSIRSWI